MKIQTVSIKADNDYGYRTINLSDLTDSDVVIGDTTKTPVEEEKVEVKEQAPKKTKTKKAKKSFGRDD